MTRWQGLLGAAVSVAMLCALLAASATARTPKDFFGVTPQGPLSERDFEKMGRANVGLLRFDLRWAGVDPTAADGDYDWSGPDHIIGEAARNGMRTLPFVFNTPEWVAKLDGAECGGDCAAFAPRKGDARRAWKDFLAAAVERYGRGGEFWAQHPEIRSKPVKAWQLWNEQNSPTFYKPRPNVKRYAKLLRAGHEAISSVDRRAKIVLGGMFGTPLGGDDPAIDAWKYLNKLYRIKGVKRTFDGVAPHPYAAKFKKRGSNRTVLGQIEAFRRSMKKGGDRRADLWITELGWSSERRGNPLNRGPKGQAKRLKEAFKYFRKHRKKLNIETVSWYSWRDNNTPGVVICDWCPESGLLKEDYDSKPSLRAFKRFTRGR